MNQLDRTTKILLWVLASVGIILIGLVIYFLFLQSNTVKIHNIGINTNFNTGQNGGATSTNIHSSSTVHSSASSTLATTTASNRLLYIQNFLNTQADWKIHSNDESGFTIKIPKDVQDSIVLGLQSKFDISLPNSNLPAGTTDRISNVSMIIAPLTSMNDQGACINNMSNTTPSPSQGNIKITNEDNRVLLRLGPNSVYRQKQSIDSSATTNFGLNSKTAQLDKMLTINVIYRFYLQSSTCYDARIIYTRHVDQSETEALILNTKELEDAIQNLGQAIITSFASN